MKKDIQMIFKWEIYPNNYKETNLKFRIKKYNKNNLKN